MPLRLAPCPGASAHRHSQHLRSERPASVSSDRTDLDANCAIQATIHGRTHVIKKWYVRHNNVVRLSVIAIKSTAITGLNAPVSPAFPRMLLHH